MFVRVKPAGGHQYLQIVHNQRLDGRVRQQVVGTLGRLDQLQAGGQVDQLLASLGRFAQESAVLGAYRQGAAPTLATVKIGPPLVFGRPENGISAFFASPTGTGNRDKRIFSCRLLLKISCVPPSFPG